MAAPILQTKLIAPRPRRTLVPRPRLTGLLDRGAEAKLTLVSAPPGFGKTTLLAAWAASRESTLRTAWLGLDPADNHVGEFWGYVISALQAVAPGVADGAFALLQSPQPTTETVLATLLNELAALPNEVVLVLDDYHVIEVREIHDSIAFVLDHLPPQVHVVIATRADAPLPLAGLRARGDLVEIRAADLRFTPGEAAAFLNDAMGLGLAVSDVATLERRTEGWIAALQLAALSIQGRDDATDFIAGFAGDDRYLVDYLVEEVLQRQPEHLRAFLLETAILTRLSGPLCDAVTGATDGNATLDSLDRANLFLVPLDDRRQWYRFHQLFADLLRARLLDERHEHIPELHRRASAWFERQADLPEAIRHALAAGDVEHAADLIERAIPAARRDRQESLMETWLGALPDDVIARRPVLGVHHAGMHLLRGRLDDVEPWLREAERRLEPPQADAAVVDTEALRRLAASMAIYRAALAQIRGDMPETVVQARRALDASREDDHMERGGASGFLALAAWRSGDLDAAAGHWAQTLAHLERAGYRSDAIGTAMSLGDVRIAQGRLRDALRVYEHGLRIAGKDAGPPIRGLADMHVGISEVLRERNELEAAAEHLRHSRELGEPATLPHLAHRWAIAMARIREANGDVAGALDALDVAEERFAPDFFPNLRPIPGMRARLWIRQGRLNEAAAWARDAGLAPEDELRYLREYEHVTLARLLLARAAPEATELLVRLLAAAETGGRTGTVIEALVLLALDLDARGDRAGALASLERALTFAEPEGFVRRFVDEGPPMAPLLREAAKRARASGYVAGLLAAFGPHVHRPSSSQGLTEPLSERELEVLLLLRSDLDGPAMARQLFVSVNTLRTHTRNVYAKLGVTSRREAVHRADELGIHQRR